MSKRKLFVLLSLMLLLTVSVCLASCNSTSGGSDEGVWETDPPSLPTTGTAKIVLYDDNVVTAPISGGKFDLWSISSYLDRSGFNYKGIYDAPEGGALVISSSGDFLMVLENDITLYPRWEAYEYTVLFSVPSESGRIDEANSSFLMKAGDAMPSVLPSPLYDESKYEFVGWSYEGFLISNKTTPKTEYKTLSFGLDRDVSMPIELIAVFEPAKLTLVFDHNDGTYQQTIIENIIYGDTFDSNWIPEITASGREIKYWSADPGGSEQYFPGTITGSITLYAIWADYKEVQFFHLSEDFTTQKYYRDGEISVPSPEREGYEFDGWYTSKSFSGNPVTSFTYGMLAPQYYARWTPILYELSLYDGETLYQTLTYTVEDQLTFPTDLKKTGYTFVGWMDEDGILFTETKEIGAIISGDLKAAYTPNKYTITYKYDDAVLEIAEVEYDSELDLLVPEKTGYDFKGYLMDGTPFTSTKYTFTEDITLEATFEIAIYKIEYVLNGAENNEKNILTYTVNDTFRFEDVFKENYSFEGWYRDAEFTDYYDEITTGTTGDITLYARFRGLSFAALLNPEGGTCQRDKVVIEYGAMYSIPVCTREGYSFDGWFTTPDGVEGVQLTDGEGRSLAVWDKNALETDIYAHYTKRHYIHLEINYPSAVKVTLKEYYLVDEQVTINAEYDEGYDFLGYYDENDVALNYSQKYQFRMPDGDVYLKLKFTPKLFTVTLNKGDAHCAETRMTVEYGQSFSLPVAFIEGKQFVGWKYGDTFITGADGVASDFYFYKKDIEVSAEFIDSADGAKLVYTYEDLLTIKDNPAGVYVLVNDIDLNGKKWEAFDFTGSIDGLDGKITGLSAPLFNNVTGNISNLTIDINASLENIEADRKPFGALCYNLNGGTLDNVTVTGQITSKGKYGIGGFAYELKGATLTNCKNYANITTSGENDHTGGLFSVMTSGSLKNCDNHGAITGIHNVGGLIGWLNGGNFRECTNFGTITGTENVGGFAGRTAFSGNYTAESIYLRNKGNINGTTNVGGIFGYFGNSLSARYNHYTTKLTHLFNEGKVTGAVNVGGIMGNSYTDNTHDCTMTCYYSNFENTGEISGTSYVGGLIGIAYSDNGASNLSNSFSKNTTVTAEYMVGGLAGRLQNISLSNSSNEGMTVIATGYYIEGTAYNAWLGGYVGYGSSISGCINACDITYSGEGRFIGGLAGRSDGTANNCSNSGTIDAPNANHVGGLVGYLFSSGERTSDNLKNSGNVNGGYAVGGVFGKIEDTLSARYNSYTLKLFQIENSGEITATGDYVGGIAGQFYCDNTHDGVIYLNATFLKNTGKVTGNSYVGGIAGYSTSDTSGGTISNLENHAVITGVSYLGGIFGQVNNTPVSKCYNYADTLVCTSKDGGTCIGGVIGKTSSVLDTLENHAVVVDENGTYIGGAVGLAEYSGNKSINNIINYASVKGKDRVGGTFGQISAAISARYDSYSITVSALFNEGEVVGNDGVGGLVGYAHVNNTHDGYYYITISDSENKANVTGKNNVGGAVGYSYGDGHVTLVRLSAKNITLTGDTYVGGIVGQGQNTDLNTCYNDGQTIVANGHFLDGTTYYAFIGGYAGLCRSIANLTNDVEITYTGMGQFIGGIAGKATGSVTSCVNNASVTAEGAAYVGGIAGHMWSSASITLTTNTGNVSGDSYVGGIVGDYSYNLSNRYNSYNVSLETLSNSGEIKAANNFAGGIFGRFDINNFHDGVFTMKAVSLNNTGAVTGNSYVGGYMGHFWSDGGSTIQLSTSTGKITGTENVNQTVGIATNLTIS